MHLMPGADARLILVDALLAGWRYTSPTVSLMASIPLNGQWPDFVDIRCCATEGDPAQTNGPWMRGRSQVPFPELVEQLQATLAERAQVIARVNKGEPGPFRFERTTWEVVDLLQFDT
jgi:hypothetical protein